MKPEKEAAYITGGTAIGISVENTYRMDSEYGAIDSNAIIKKNCNFEIPDWKKD